MLTSADLSSRELRDGCPENVHHHPAFTRDQDSRARSASKGFVSSIRVRHMRPAPARQKHKGEIVAASHERTGGGFSREALASASGSIARQTVSDTGLLRTA